MREWTSFNRNMEVSVPCYLYKGKKLLSQYFIIYSISLASYLFISETRLSKSSKSYKNTSGNTTSPQ